MNKRAAKYCAQNTPNFVGIPGTLPSTVDTFLGAGDKIVELGCPEGEELHLILNRKMSSAYVTARANQFNPQTEVSEQIKKGRIVDATLGYTINRDQGIYAHSTGTFAGTPLIDTNNQQADGGDNATMNIVLKGFTGGVSAIKKGDKFTIDNVYAVHPQIRQIGPGSCPICGMALEPLEVTADQGPNPELLDMRNEIVVLAALGFFGWQRLVRDR